MKPITKYNDHGDCIYYKDSDGEEYEYEYKYDENGNCIFEYCKNTNFYREKIYDENNTDNLM